MFFEMDQIEFSLWKLSAPCKPNVVKNPSVHICFEPSAGGRPKNQGGYNYLRGMVPPCSAGPGTYCNTYLYFVWNTWDVSITDCSPIRTRYSYFFLLTLLERGHRELSISTTWEWFLNISVIGFLGGTVFQHFSHIKLGSKLP